MQTPIRNFEETKPITAGSMTPFNVNCYGVIRDLMIEFTNSGAPASLANCLSSISRVVVLINGMNAIDVKLSQIVDLFGYMGTRVNQTTLYLTTGDISTTISTPRFRVIAWSMPQRLCIRCLSRVATTLRVAT